MEKVKQILAVLLCFYFASCQGPENNPIEAQVNIDSGPDGLFADFLSDGKYDELGHPIGAHVFEAEFDCEPSDSRPGILDDHGWRVNHFLDSPGIVCQNKIDTLGIGTHTINVYAFVVELDYLNHEDEIEILQIKVYDEQSDELVAERNVNYSDFIAPYIYQNIPLEFKLDKAGSVRFEIHWSGAVTMTFDYIEVFLAKMRVILNPPSGIIEDQTDFEIEVRIPKYFSTINLYCNDQNITARMEEMVDSGLAIDQQNDFRRLMTAPMEQLFEGCQLPRYVQVEAWDGYVTEKRQVIYLDAMMPCAEEPKDIEVLITGFVPFPPNPIDHEFEFGRDNSSQYAIENFDSTWLENELSAELGTIGITRMVLPVEFESAPAMIADFVDRCHPNAVVSFGQGRGKYVDLETTAYNLKDSSDVTAGYPDNRGIVAIGEKIISDGPDSYPTRLPYQKIIDELLKDYEHVRESKSAGRYVCNNVFYNTLVNTESEVPAGFVHLPSIYRVEEEDKELLQQIVETVLYQTLVETYFL
jgi:pyroglutamyl-peptidase